MPWAISLTTPTQDRQTHTHRHTLPNFLCPPPPLTSFITYTLYQLHPQSGFGLYHPSKSSPPKPPLLSLFQNVAGTVGSLLLDFPGHRALWTTLPLKQHFAELQDILWGPSFPLSSVALCASLWPLHCVVPHSLALHASFFSLQGLCLEAPFPPTHLQIPAGSWCLSNSPSALIIFLCPTAVYPLDPMISAGPKLDLPAHFHIPCLCEWTTPRAHLPH